MVDGTNGQVLSTDGNGVAYWGTISVGSLTLDGLSDVSIVSPSSDQILRYGLRQGDTVPVWHNFTPNFLTPSSSIDSLGDVTITTAATGQLLRYNGSAWVNWTPNFLTSLPAHTHDDRYYTESEIDSLFAGETEIDGYNRGAWDIAYNDKINSASFSTTTGVLTLTQQDTGTVTVDLDGRYLESLPTATSTVLGGIKVGTNLSISNGVLSATDTDTVTSVGIDGDLSTGNIELRGGGATTITKSGGTITISSTDTDTNTTYSAGTGLTLTGTTFSVTSGTYAAASHNHDDRYYTETESDSRYVNASGDTMSGDLTLSGYTNPHITLTTTGGNYSYLELLDGSSAGYVIKNQTSSTSNGVLPGSLYLYTDSSKATQIVHNGTSNAAFLSGGDVYIRGQVYVGGNGASTGTQLVYNSGTWGINITGSAGSATTSSSTYRGIIEDTRAAQRTPNDYDDYRVSWEFTNQIPGLSGNTSWWSVMTMQGWHNGYSAWQIIGSSSSAIDDFYLRAGNNTTWNTARRIWHSGDFTSTDVSNWNTAYGWGDHAEAGYLTDFSYTETDTLSSVTGRGGSTGSAVVMYGKVTLGNNSSGTYNGNTTGLTINSTAEIRSTGIQNPPALTWHYEGLATRHLLITSAGAMNFVSPSNEASGVAVVQVNGNTVWHAGNLTNLNQLTNGPGYLTSLPAHTHAASDITSGTLSTDRLPKQELGISITGNFGQWEPHGTYTNFNTDVAYWGWSYVQGNGNAPHAQSQQWYRGRFSLGSQYGLGSDGGDYWMEIAIPRYAQGNNAGNLFVRTAEGGVPTAWQGVRGAYSTNAGYAVSSGNSSTTDQTDFNTLSIQNRAVATQDFVTSQGYITGSYLPLTGGTLSGAVIVNLGNVSSDTVAFKVGGPSNYDSLTIGMEDTPDYDAFIASYGNDIRFYSGKGVATENHSFYWFTSKAGTAQHSVVAMQLDHNQNLTIGGTFTEQSSIRYKENVKSIPSVSQKVEQLDAVSYNKIGGNQEEIGLIAEDVAELFPEVVKYDNEGRPDGINYSRLSVILLKAVQELTERVNKLENK